MARKHRKAGIVKQAVERTVVSSERKVVLDPVSGEFVVKKVEVVKQGKASGSTTRRGKPNEMPSKGGFKGTPLKGAR